jgi:hypothetical protein
MVEMKIILRSAQYALPFVSLPDLQLHGGRDNTIGKKVAFYLLRRSSLRLGQLKSEFKNQPFSVGLAPSICQKEQAVERPDAGMNFS